MSSTENGDKEKPEKGASRAGERPQVDELAGRLMRLLETLKEAPARQRGARDEKLASDFLEMAESFYESLVTPGEGAQEEKQGSSPEENSPVSNKPAVSEAEPGKEPADVHGETVIAESSQGMPDSSGGMGEITESSNEPLFQGEVKLIVITPANVGTVLKLYNYLQTLPDIKLVYTSGTRDTEISIALDIDKPAPLLNIISKVGGVSLVEGDIVEKATHENVMSFFAGKKGAARELRLICAELSVGDKS